MHGTRGGGHARGPLYREQVTAGLTPEQFAYLRSITGPDFEVNLAAALRCCINRCMGEDKCDTRP